MGSRLEIDVQSPDVSIVVPVYKEEKNIQPFLERMEKVLASMKVGYEILFCLDPSPDRTVGDNCRGDQPQSQHQTDSLFQALWPACGYDGRDFDVQW